MSASFACSEELKSELNRVAKEIVANGKGILAADESTGTIGKRFQPINVENTEENRRAFRELLFAPAKDLNSFLGGVIVFEEQLTQKTKDGRLFVDVLKSAGIHVGIKVDKGLVDIPGLSSNEKVAQGLDDLEKKCREFKQKGATFAKWRSVISIGPDEPTSLAIEMNANVLACYAAICQKAGIVPIVEPEVLRDGDHDLVTATVVTAKVLDIVYQKLALHKVYLPGTLLKPNIVGPGEKCKINYSPQDMARATYVTLLRNVPSEVVGITFLSGGLSEKDASIILNAINVFADKKQPWALTFSYGRALQATVLKTWAGKEANGPAAQAALKARAKHNNLAAQGKYKVEEDKDATEESLFVADYKY